MPEPRYKEPETGTKSKMEAVPSVKRQTFTDELPANIEEPIAVLAIKPQGQGQKEVLKVLYEGGNEFTVKNTDGETIKISVSNIQHGDNFESATISFKKGNQTINIPVSDNGAKTAFGITIHFMGIMEASKTEQMEAILGIPYEDGSFSYMPSVRPGQKAKLNESVNATARCLRTFGTNEFVMGEFLIEWKQDGQNKQEKVLLKKDFDPYQLPAGGNTQIQLLDLTPAIEKQGQTAVVSFRNPSNGELLPIYDGNTGQLLGNYVEIDPAASAPVSLTVGGKTNTYGAYWAERGEETNLMVAHLYVGTPDKEQMSGVFTPGTEFTMGFANMRLEEVIEK